jgi:lipoprotein-anchoring transpeptidase ErfK/SrfK
MKGPLVLTLAVLAALSSAHAPSVAQTRYTPPPPVILSPDWVAPWMLPWYRPPVTVYRPRTTVRQPEPDQLNRNRRAARSLGLTPYQRGIERRQLPNLNTRLGRLEQPQPERPSQGGEIDPQFLPRVINFRSQHPAGTILIDTEARYLYLVEGNGTARRYGVGVGKPGFEWAGAHQVTRKAEWPSWTPPKAMIEREARKGHHLPEFVEGGPDNPLGARALYLGSTLYRVHGTNQPWTIGRAVSSGCIRMRNEDVIDLYNRVQVGAKVIVS